LYICHPISNVTRNENVVIKQKEINVNGETVEISMEFVYKDGSKEIKSFKLNLEDGSLIE